MSKNEIAVLEKKEISPIESKVEKITIIDEKTKTIASEYLSQLNKSLDKVVAYKEAKTKPLNQALKVIRAETKPIETRLEDMIRSLRSKLGSYQTEQFRIAQEKKEKIANRVGEGKGKLKSETAIAQIDEVDTPDKTVSTQSGSVNFKTVNKFEVVDMKLLPLGLHMPDMSAIQEQMKKGIEFPGVRYFTEQVPVNHR